MGGKRQTNNLLIVALYVTIYTPDAGPGSPGGGYQNGSGDHQLLSYFQPTSQPQPGVYTALPEGDVCYV